MKKNKIFVLSSALLACTFLAGCGGDGAGGGKVDPTVSSLIVNVPSGTSKYVGSSIDQDDFLVFKKYSDGHTEYLNKGEYSISPNDLPYTFKDSDRANGKTYVFTYQNTISKSIKLSVDYKILNDVDWKNKIVKIGGISKTPYECACQASEVYVGKISGHQSEISSLTSYPIGETEDDDVNLYYNEIGNKLYILSHNAVQFNNNDNNGGLFKNCSATTIAFDDNGVNFDDITSFEDMFNGCSSLSTLSGFNFSDYKVNNMKNMFNGCNKLTTLNLSYFSYLHTEGTFDNMFNGCSLLNKIIVYKDKGFRINLSTPVNMFNECNQLTGENGTTTAAGTTSALACFDKGPDSDQPGLFSITL